MCTFYVDVFNFFFMYLRVYVSSVSLRLYVLEYRTRRAVERDLTWARPFSVGQLNMAKTSKTLYAASEPLNA